MKAVRFKISVPANGQITVPPEVAQQILPGEQVQIIILWDAAAIDDSWGAADGSGLKRPTPQRTRFTSN